ncbi:MAG: hypothetical protein GYB27_10885 [Rhodobacteraceae bacterium]|nr:hypothetical protein [Paracoccaceae bacterium]
MSERRGGEAPRGPTLFLERQSCRRRRLSEVARLMPIFGAGLFMVPLLWPVGDESEQVQTSSAILYLFCVWGGLILAIALFGLVTRSWAKSDQREID